MMWVCLVLLLLLYVSAIFCKDAVGSAGQDVYSGRETVGAKIDSDPIVAEFNNFVYFGNIHRSMYTLFCVAIMAEWPEFGRAVMEKQPMMFFFFLVFIIFTTFGVMNVIIGVIVDNTMEAAKSIEAEDEATEKERKRELLQ